MDTAKQPPTVRVSGLIVADGCLLLVRQAAGEHTYWLLPGGGVHRGETLTAALTREIMEECGLSVAEIGPPFALIESISPDSGRRRHVLQLVMGVRVAGEPASARPCDPAVIEVGWFLADQAAGLELHPPIADLMPGWVAHIEAHSLSCPPGFVATGRRWID